MFMSPRQRPRSTVWYAQCYNNGTLIRFRSTDSERMVRTEFGDIMSKSYLAEMMNGDC